MRESARDAREGVLEQAGEDRWQLRFVRRLAHPREKVWRALTTESELAGWFPTTIEGELRPGAPLRFSFRGAAVAPETGRMVACEPPALLEFTWGGTGDRAGTEETVRFELAPDGDGCVLTFLTTYVEYGKSARDAAGWHACFDALEAQLRGESADAAPPWTELRDRYAAKFGPAAARIGPPEGFEAG
jgi:uncharacterized protein YndB with AHSA1/START domain